MIRYGNLCVDFAPILPVANFFVITFIAKYTVCFCALFRGGLFYDFFSENKMIYNSFTSVAYQSSSTHGILTGVILPCMNAF